MKDPRIQKLSEVLVHHSTKLQAGDNVLIEAFSIPDSLVKALIRTATAAQAKPYLWIKDYGLIRDMLIHASEEQLKLVGEMELSWMKKMDAYIGIRGGLNVNELSDVPQDKMKLYQDHILKPVHFQERVNNTRWVVLRYPTPSFAQQAGKSSDAFEDFFFDVCTMDYNKMDTAMQPLVRLMENTDRVHIKGPETDLHFSIKGIPVVGCSGTHNIPDGEVFTAPLRNSVNGYIKFNTPTIYHGVTFSDVYLRFENGKVLEAKSDKIEKLNEILDTDEGARYIGEFALGFNPYIINPMLDILFDEKISGSFHFTPGQAYEDADNGNKSNVHWDMVMRQTAETGGGEIYFDGKLIRKDGLFVPDDLKGLNPENLK
jgi:aminopeptidase